METLEGLLLGPLYILILCVPLILFWAVAIPVCWFTERRCRLHLSTALVLMVAASLAIPVVRWILHSYVAAVTDWDEVPIADEAVHLMMLMAVTAVILWIGRLWEAGIERRARMQAVRITSL